MKQLSTVLINSHQRILRTIIVFVAIVIIHSLMPKAAHFEYEFTKNTPWTYEDLVSPIDFSIQKTTAELEQEQQEIKQNFIPFYTINNELADSLIDAFVVDLGNQYFSKEINPKLFDEHKAVGLQLLETVYEIGIINPKLIKNRPLVYVVNGNKADKVETASFLTKKNILSKSLKVFDEINQDSIHLLTGTFSHYVQSNVFIDSIKSNQILNEELSSIGALKGNIQKGQLLIAKGQIIDEELHNTLNSLKYEYEESGNVSKSSLLVQFGYLLLAAFILGIYSFFIKLYIPKTFKNTKHLSFLLFSIVTLSFVCFTAFKVDGFTWWILPLCIGPIIFKNFFSEKVAFVTHIFITLISCIIIGEGLAFILVQTLAGAVAIYTNFKTRYWAQFFKSIASIFGTYLMLFIAFEFVYNGNFSLVNVDTLKFIAFNAFMTLMAYPLIPVFERVFGFLSEIRLVELSDMNHPLLKRLSVKAPGTFQHSLQVANLAEAAAEAIKANRILVRVGALYHDIGKLSQPQFYIENQNTGINPHDELEFDESAKIIINHVSEGIKIAKEEGLPDRIIDFIRTHHGNSRVEYFYRHHIKSFPEDKVEQKFRYPGPLPFDKETSILMIADSVEAASKSLQNPTEKDIITLVNNIVKHKINDNQFIHSTISLKEIDLVKNVFIKRLKSIYHVRVSYEE